MKIKKKLQNFIFEKPFSGLFIKKYIRVLNIISRASFLFRKLIYRLFPFLNKSKKFPINILNTRIWLEKNLNSKNELIKIYPSKTVKRKKPKCIEKEIHYKFRREYKRKIRSGYILKLKNGRVWGEYGNIITENGVLLSDVSISHYRIFRRYSLPRITKIDKNVGVLTADHGENYFHWLFKILPRFRLLEESDLQIDKYLINYSNKPFQDQTLKMLNIALDKIIPSSDNLYLEVSNLIVPSLIKFATFPDWACNYLRLKFLTSNYYSNNQFEHIFISRKKAIGRKILNEQEFINFLLKIGFKKVILENLDFKKQIRIFHSAKIIISPHGAGLANLVFCQPNTKIIELFSPNYISQIYYSLSNRMNLEYYYLLGKSNYLKSLSSFGVRNNIYIDLNKFKRLLKYANII